MTSNSNDPVAAFEEALRRIQNCGKKKDTILHLSGLGLTTLPPEIGQLTDLTELYTNPRVFRALSMKQLDDPAQRIVISKLADYCRQRAGVSWNSYVCIFDCYVA